MKKCVTCGGYKQEDEFNFKVRSLGLRQPWCRDCQHGHQRTWYEKHTEQEKELKEEELRYVRKPENLYINIYPRILVLSVERRIRWFWSSIT